MLSALKSSIIPTSQRRQVDANYGKLSAQGTGAGDTCPANLSSLSLTCWYFQLESGTFKNNVMIKYMYHELFTSRLNKHCAPNYISKQQLVFCRLSPLRVFIQSRPLVWRTVLLTFRVGLAFSFNPWGNTIPDTPKDGPHKFLRCFLIQSSLKSKLAGYRHRLSLGTGCHLSVSSSVWRCFAFQRTSFENQFLFSVEMSKLSST